MSVLDSKSGGLRPTTHSVGMVGQTMVITIIGQYWFNVRDHPGRTVLSRQSSPLKADKGMTGKKDLQYTHRIRTRVIRSQDNCTTTAALAIHKDVLVFDSTPCVVHGLGNVLEAFIMQYQKQISILHVNYNYGIYYSWYLSAVDVINIELAEK